MEITDLQSYAEQYFSSNNFLNKKILEDISHVRDSYEDAWHGLEENEKEQVINEHIIFPEVMIQHAKNADQSKPQPTSFPRLKIRTGQKFIVEDGNTSQSEGNGTYSYRDEHSSPFGWKTRSQQNINFDIYKSSETASNSTDGLDLVAARRSTILSCPFGQYSRVPKVSKPVSIPVVPELPETKRWKDCEVVRDISEVTSLVSSIVIENENNIVLDFSAPVTKTLDDYYEGSSTCSTINSPAPSTPISARGESSSLISKVRDKTASLKRSLTPTMKRKKSITSTDTLSTTATECDTYSPDQTPTRICPRSSPSRVIKPACLPPPPPVHRPVAPPPPPPTKTIEIKPKTIPPAPPQRDPMTRISTFVADVVEAKTTEEGEKDANNLPPEKPEIPKTGFDFLDEW
eukprot:TRINITY_DN22618_c0_g1_i5.p1 TRINITY_DN22618_c0_g1~~TRINITY_DN22618_c0_g1_i5.p1  ORF type:complete len:403 (+),score=102.37 TRINITY_DN22618_c0_g1_i5:70-1278(+)